MVVNNKHHKSGVLPKHQLAGVDQEHHLPGLNHRLLGTHNGHHPSGKLHEHEHHQVRVQQVDHLAGVRNEIMDTKSRIKISLMAGKNRDTAKMNEMNRDILKRCNKTQTPKVSKQKIRGSLKHQLIFEEDQQTFHLFGKETLPIRGTKASMVRSKKVFQMYPRTHGPSQY